MSTLTGEQHDSRQLEQCSATTVEHPSGMEECGSSPPREQRDGLSEEEGIFTLNLVPASLTVYSASLSSLSITHTPVPSPITAVPHPKSSLRFRNRGTSNREGRQEKKEKKR